MKTIRWGISPPPPVSDAQAMGTEHGALVRQMATLQHRVSEQLAGYAWEVRTLETEVVRLRGRLLRARTASLWGLPVAGLSASRPSAAPPSRTHPVAPASQGAPTVGLPEASAVICQTGCTGHAHPWLEPDGLCRRTGNACDSLPALAKASKT